MSESAEIWAIVTEELATLLGHAQASVERMHEKFQALSLVDWADAEESSGDEVVKKQPDLPFQASPQQTPDSSAVEDTDVYIPSFSSSAKPRTNRQKRREAVTDCILKCVKSARSPRGVKKTDVLDYVAKHSGHEVTYASLTNYISDLEQSNRINVERRGRLLYLSVP